MAALRARAREFEGLAAPARFAPSLLSLKQLPCCALPGASAPWAAAATAGGFVLAAAASLACFAGVAAAAAGAGAGAECEAAAAPLTTAVTSPEEEEEQTERQRERQQRASSCGCWPGRGRRRRRRDGFFRSRDASVAAGTNAAADAGGGDVFPEGEVEPRPWPTL